MESLPVSKMRWDSSGTIGPYESEDAPLDARIVLIEAKYILVTGNDSFTSLKELRMHQIMTSYVNKTF